MERVLRHPRGLSVLQEKAQPQVRDQRSFASVRGLGGPAVQDFFFHPDEKH